MTKSQFFKLILEKNDMIELSSDKRLDYQINIFCKKNEIERREYEWLIDLLDVYKNHVSVNIVATFTEILSDYFKIEDDTDLLDSETINKLVADVISNPPPVV